MARMKKVEAIAWVVLALTAVVAIYAIRVSTTEPIATEPQETVSETTTATTAPERTEPTQVPTEATQPSTEPTQVIEPTVAPEEPPATKPFVMLYAVPLSEDLQLHIINLCEGKRIDPAVVMAMIWRESRYNASSIGDNGNSFGLMQIQERFHRGLMAEFGCDDLLDPYQNVTVGIAILAGHLQRWDRNIEMALVSYNCGATGAYNNYFSKGVYSSKYSQSVMEMAEELRGESYAFFK